MTRARGLVLLGGSYAASQIAATAREHGYLEPIHLISNESELPYQRPPLSKTYLNGMVEESKLLLRPASFYRANCIEPILGSQVVEVDANQKSVKLDSGEKLDYDVLAFAVGARPRELNIKGSDLAGVRYLRSIDDARFLRKQLDAIQSVVIIGAGFIGLEVAASLVQLGKKITVLEMQDRVLKRAVAPCISDYLSNLHGKHGVEIRLNTIVREFSGDQGHVKFVICDDGSKIPADVVIVGIGVVPNQQLAVLAGVNCDDGIIIDQFCRTNNMSIVAAGDCASCYSPYARRRIRLESVQNAIDQAKTAGASVAGLSKPYVALPWFWSDQYKVKLQTAGLSQDYDSVQMRSSAGSDQFSVFYFRSEILVAVDSLNRPGDHMKARKLLAAGIPISLDQLASADFDLGALSELQ